jgi:RNA polymerase sigma-70 factor (sigma-E family)
VSDSVADREFDAFVRSTWRQLRQAAYALTGDTDDAEDLLQTVLAGAYARWPRLNRDDDPVAYVRRALVNRYIDTWRRRRVVREDAVERPPERESEDPSARLDDRSHLASLLAELSPRERTMVVMRHYLDLSEQDVATAMGCSVGTVKSTCSRALRRLRVPVSPLLEDHR